MLCHWCGMPLPAKYKPLAAQDGEGNWYHAEVVGVQVDCLKLATAVWRALLAS